MNLKTFIKVLFLVAALSMMGFYFFKYWSQLQQYDWHFNIGFLLLSILCLWICISLSYFIFKVILYKLVSVKIAFPQVFRMISISNAGRYLPGKLWSVMGYFYFTRQYGVSKQHTTLAIIANEVCSKGSGVLLGIGYFIFSPLMKQYIPLMIFLLLLCLVFIHPRLLNIIINFGLRILKKPPIEIDFKYSSIILFFFMHFTVWIFYGLSFYIMVNSLTSTESINIFQFITIIPLCWIVGYIMIFAPGGIGVREGMLVIMLGEFMPTEIALVIAIFQRVWFTSVEGANFLISLFIPAKTDSTARKS